MRDDSNDYQTLSVGVALAHAELLGGRITARRRQQRRAEVETTIQAHGWSGDIARAARRSALAHYDCPQSYSFGELWDELELYVAEQEAAGIAPDDMFAAMLAAGKTRMSE